MGDHFCHLYKNKPSSECGNQPNGIDAKCGIIPFGANIDGNEMEGFGGGRGGGGGGRGGGGGGRGGGGRGGGGRGGGGRGGGGRGGWGRGGWGYGRGWGYGGYYGGYGGYGGGWGWPWYWSWPWYDEIDYPVVIDDTYPEPQPQPQYSPANWVIFFMAVTMIILMIMLYKK